jgi:hypothetical protein
MKYTTYVRVSSGFIFFKARIMALTNEFWIRVYHTNLSKDLTSSFQVSAAGPILWITINIIVGLLW